MEPKIIKTKNYIEFIGHYDDITKCAKLSALASLYAIDSRTGYAKFPIKYEKDIDKVLNCFNIFAGSVNDTYITYNRNNSSGSSYATVTIYLYDVKSFIFNNITYNIGLNSNIVILLKLNYNGNESKYEIWKNNGTDYIRETTFTNNLDFIITDTLNNNLKYKIETNVNYFTTSISDGKSVSTQYTLNYIDNDNYERLIVTLKNSVYTNRKFNILVNLPQTSQPLSKTYNVGTFINDNQEYNQIVVNGMSSDSSTFESITDIDYRNTLTEASDTVYSNSTWNGNYNSILNYTTTVPDVTTINSDCNSIVTFTTNQVEPASSISIGTRSLSASHIGTSEVNKIYYGTNLVYEKAVSGFTQKYLTNSGNSSLLSDMQQNKIYTIYYTQPNKSVLNQLAAFIYSNGTWDIQEISGTAPRSYLTIESQTANSVTIVQGGGANFHNRDTQYIILEGDAQATTSDFTGYTPTSGLAYWFCFVAGTKITLADGATKKVEDIDYNDDLLVWNFYDGKLDSAKPKWIMEEKPLLYINQYYFQTIQS